MRLLGHCTRTHPQSPYAWVQVTQHNGVPLCLKAMIGRADVEAGDAVWVKRTDGGYRGWVVEKVMSEKETRMSTISKVEEFHRSFGQPVDRRPGLGVSTPEEVSAIHSVADQLLALGKTLKRVAGDHASLRLLRLQLLVEEVGELAEAMAEEDLVAALDAFIDIQYVLDGGMISFGLDQVKAEAFAEVHSSNMSKLGASGEPVIDPHSGRVMKGPNYRKPDLRRFVK